MIQLEEQFDKIEINNLVMTSPSLMALDKLLNTQLVNPYVAFLFLNTIICYPRFNFKYQITRTYALSNTYKITQVVGKQS